jgi:ketosteroid isomerase-like protein
MSEGIVPPDDNLSAAERLVREHLNLTARGDLEAAEANVTSDFFNHRCMDEPMEARQRGPEGLKATLRWLHRAFTEMRFEFHEVLVAGDRAVARVTLHARQHGPFVVHDSPDGRVTDAFLPTDGLLLPRRPTGSGSPGVPSPNTTQSVTISEWPNNLAGFRLHLSTLFACSSPVDGNVVTLLSLCWLTAIDRIAV